MQVENAPAFDLADVSFGNLRWSFGRIPAALCFFIPSPTNKNTAFSEMGLR